MGKNNISIINVVFIIFVALFVLLLGVSVYALPRQGFSEDENRVLAPLPRLSLERLLDGRLFGEISDFYSDRIPMRRTMVRTKAVCELALGRSQNNGVLFLDGGRLCDRCEYESLDMLNSNLKALRELSEGLSAKVFLAPRSVDVYFGGDESEMITELVRSVLGGYGLYEELKKAAEDGTDVYYKTDHHLSADGAYILYRRVLEGLGDEPYDMTDFDRVTVSRSFLGSAYSASGLLPVAYDNVELYRYEGDSGLSVYCEDTGCELCGLYCFDELEAKDKYRVFLGGNHGVLHVESGQGRKRLLIIKDSFANAVIPMLARHYDLTVIDPRYGDICVPDGVDATVVIMGVDTLSSLLFF